MSVKNTIPADIMEKLSKYPALEESVHAYLETLEMERKHNLSVDAVKVLESQEDIKPIEGLFRASVGTDGNVPAEVLDVIGKYPEFEAGLNAYLKTLAVENMQHPSIDAVNVMKSQADVKPVKAGTASAEELQEEILEKLRKYPDVEEQLSAYLKTMKREKELNLSIDAVSVLDK